MINEKKQETNMRPRKDIEKYFDEESYFRQGPHMCREDWRVFLEVLLDIRGLLSDSRTPWRDKNE